MRQSHGTLLVALLLLALGGCTSPARRSTLPSHLQGATPSILIRDVTVIDATGKPPQRHVDVLIANERVRTILTHSSSSARADVILDGTNKFLMPGLWDMHVHLGDYVDAARALPGLLAQGITAIRDMGTPLDDALRLRHDAATGVIASPRIYTTGPLLNRRLPFDSPLLRQVATADEARAAVRMLQQAGVDFVKIADSVTRDGFLAIAAESRARGIRFVGHVPPSVSAAEASDAGQASIEHLGGRYQAVLLACSRDEARLEAQARAIFEAIVEGAWAKTKVDDAGVLRHEFVASLVDTYDDAKAASLFAQFVHNMTWQVPTLVAIRGFWDDAALTDEDRRQGDRLKAKQLTVVRSMAHAGVRILAGTDSPVGSAPSALPDELKLLVEAGLSPMQALQAATRDAAAFVGDTSTGTVEPGKIADLVLLDGDPLSDMSNMRRVSAVIQRGRLVQRGQKD